MGFSLQASLSSSHFIFFHPLLSSDSKSAQPSSSLVFNCPSCEFSSFPQFFLPHRLFHPSFFCCSTAVGGCLSLVPNLAKIITTSLFQFPTPQPSILHSPHSIFFSFLFFSYKPLYTSPPRAAVFSADWASNLTLVLRLGDEAGLI